MWMDGFRSSTQGCYEHVPTLPWTEIVDYYREIYDAGCWGQKYRPMVGLVEAISASAYAPYLFGRNTSPYRMHHHQGQLDLCRARTLVKRHQVLSISFVPADDWFLFDYHEAAFAPNPWATVSTSMDGFAKLEWVLSKRLRWFRTDSPRRSDALPQSRGGLRRLWRPYPPYEFP